MEGKNLIAVTNRHLCTRPFLDVIRDLAKKELKTIVLREKDLLEEEYLHLARQCKEICEQEGASLTIHNFVNTARILEIDRIHLPFPVFLKEAGNLKDFAWVSTSIHKPEEAKQAQDLGADFVFAGHVFATDCKKGLEPRGLDFLKKTVEGVQIPVYGIGGIHENNIEQIMETGAAGGCMMSEFMRLPAE
ncbi:MAG: thiamine phosphate synthase [Anaerostipes sp.]|uniref:thiamine phosphate synthase n=1 Tax=Anaerostipes sp. TaxID=1872530 RepID=UPI003995F845